MRTFEKSGRAFPCRAHIATAILSLNIFTTVFAEPITYTGEYDANVLPTDTEGSSNHPLWEIMAQETGAATHIEGDALVASTTESSGTNMLFWGIGDNDGRLVGTNQAWSINPENGVTVDFRIQVTATKPHKNTESRLDGGFMIQVVDGERGVNFYFSPSGITAQGASISKSDPMNLSTGYTNFRITMQDGKASLYQAEFETPIFSDIVGTETLRGYNRIIFGDFTSDFSGSYNLKFIKWNNTLANFSAPASP